LKSVSATCYIRPDAINEASPGLIGRVATDQGFFTGRTAMTTEIFSLTAQIHRWLDLHVARYLAAQAAKLSH
jgi:hypothetical protein